MLWSREVLWCCGAVLTCGADPFFSCLYIDMEREIYERQLIIFDTARVWTSFKFYTCARYILSLRSMEAAELMISKYGLLINEMGVSTRRQFTHAVNVEGVWTYSLNKDMWRNAAQEDDFLLLLKMKEIYFHHFSDSSTLLASDEDDNSLVFN